jgi:DNA polymerase III subunit delta'
MNLVLHGNTVSHLNNLVSDPPHAILIAASSGSGKMSLAQNVVAKILNVEPPKVPTHQYVKILAAPDRKTISIEDVRELQKFMQLKTIGKSRIRRAVIIEQAEHLTTEAQNALLKLLEEPPADTIIILTASHVRALLPTIRSRIQLINLVTPSKEQLAQHFKALNYSDENIAKAYFLSGGLPGLMHSLLSQDTEHPLVTSVIQAKQILQQTPLEKLAAVDRLSKQKDETWNTIDAIQRIAHAALNQAAERGSKNTTAQWHKVQKQSFAAKEALQKNANTKLVLTKLLLHV